MAENMVHLTSRVPQGLIDKLEEMAKQRRMNTGENASRADLVREALEALVVGRSTAGTGQPLMQGKPVANWDTFGAVAMDALTDLESLAKQCGVDDAQDMAITLGMAAQRDPRAARLRAFVRLVHGTLQSEQG